MIINTSKSIEITEKAKEKNNKKVGSSSHASVEGPHGGPSSGTTITRKTSVIKMNIMKKNRVQDSDSDADDDWVTFMNARGWTKDQIWEELSPKDFVSVCLFCIVLICKGSIV